MDIVSNKCSLCYKGNTIEDYNKLVCIDSMQLCEDCYSAYIKDYNKISMLCNSVRKYRNLIRLINEYTHQEIVSRTEDIRDYIDDDKEGNKDIIGELKEEREHWRDIEKIISNANRSDLYCNWWEVGLYE